MLAKQYTIMLPADYDMEIVRVRVRDRGSVFDTWPGLGFKAFLISERDRGATANRYAPFYLWNDVAGTNQFLYGDGFAQLAGSFGRPLIEQWIPLAVHAPAANQARPPRCARREDLPVADHEQLSDVRERERRWIAERGADERFRGGVVGLDPYRWQLLRFAMWDTPATQQPADTATTYEVLRLSAP